MFATFATRASLLAQTSNNTYKFMTTM